VLDADEFTAEGTLEANSFLSRATSPRGIVRLQFDRFVEGVGHPGRAIGVTTVPPTRRVHRELAALGYDYLGEAGVPQRHHFRRRQPDAVNLLLRNYLRRHPEEAAAYAHAKRSAIEAGGHCSLRYSELKRSTIAELLARARAEASTGLDFHPPGRAGCALPLVA
jgi:hypothetical protein